MLTTLLNERNEHGDSEALLSYLATKLIAALALWMGQQSYIHKHSYMYSDGPHDDCIIGVDEAPATSINFAVIARPGTTPPLLPKTLHVLQEALSAYPLGEIGVTVVAPHGFHWDKLVYDKAVQRVEVREPSPPAVKRNIAARIALRRAADVILFIDDDIVLSLEAVEGLIDTAEYAYTHSSIVQPLAISYERDWLGIYHDYEGTLNGVYYHKPPRLLYATTCCTAYPTKLFAENIQFSSVFTEAAGEDIDISLQALSHGYKIIAWNNISIVHDYMYRLSRDPLKAFIGRYMRYGRGNALLEKLRSGYFQKLRYASPRRSTGFNSVERAQPSVPETIRNIGLLMAEAVRA